VAGEIDLLSRFAVSSENIGTAAREPVPAAQYVRMSTEHQRYSTENQSDAILQYAVRYGFDIVRTYADNGKSGLRLDGRDALKQLLIDVEGGPRGSRPFSSTTSAVGAGSRTPTRAPITNMSAGARGSRSAIAPSNSKTTAASPRRSSRR
jgi:hypothetical protein